jgi:hypothetical protein
MNKPTRKDERLLAETFHENWESGATAQFARAAAAHARNRRRARHATATLAGLAVLACGLFVARDRFAPRVVIAQAQRSPVAATPTRGYEVISDDELLAQLRDRPVLAVQKPNGTREIVVLESEPKSETLE